MSYPFTQQNYDFKMAIQCTLPPESISDVIATVLISKQLLFEVKITWKSIIHVKSFFLISVAE